MKEEQRLIRKIQKSGDRIAADTLVRKYYDEILHFMRKQIFDNEAALDMTQEVFISVLRTIGRYDLKKGAGFRTWLYKIATDKTIDYFRSRASEKTESLPMDETRPADDTDFTQQLENSDFAERVCAFIGGLPSDTQKIFRLHIFGGYTFQEIARDMILPESSIKSKYYRLLTILRKEFDSYAR